MNDSEQKHQRQKPRFESNFKVQIELPGPENIRQGEVVNIGTGGMFLAIRFPLPPVGNTIHFKIRINQPGLIEAATLEGTAIVRWIRKDAVGNLPVGCGVEFTDLTTASKSHLNTLLDKLRSLEFIPNS